MCVCRTHKSCERPCACFKHKSYERLCAYVCARVCMCVSWCVCSALLELPQAVRACARVPQLPEAVRARVFHSYQRPCVCACARVPGTKATRGQEDRMRFYSQFIFSCAKRRPGHVFTQAFNLPTSTYSQQHREMLKLLRRLGGIYSVERLERERKISMHF